MDAQVDPSRNPHSSDAKKRAAMTLPHHSPTPSTDTRLPNALQRVPKVGGMYRDPWSA